MAAAVLNVTLSGCASRRTSTGGWDESDLVVTYSGRLEVAGSGGRMRTRSVVGDRNVTNAATDAPIGAARPAFVNRSAGWPAFVNVNLNLGMTYANQTAQLRFRIGADSTTGAPGWDVDNVVVTGLTNTPFAALVAETGSCPP